MARISVVCLGGRYRITLRGRLAGKDLKRLERACHDALEYESVPLELNLDHVLTIDDSARAYLERLRARGAAVRGDLENRYRS